MIKNREPIVEQINEIVKSLREAADRFEIQGKYFARNGNADAVQSLVNELLWLTPNLGIQRLISRMVRELERSDDK